MPFLVALLVLSFLLTRLAVPRFSDLLKAGGAVRKNYAGDLIPTAAGISLIAVIIINYFSAALVVDNFRVEILSALVVVLGVGLLGLMDDLLGTRDTTGLKGHLTMLLKGKLTTGGLKALGGGGLAFGFSLLFSHNVAELLVNTGLVALFTNALNLTDLRPGRAAKVFLMLGSVFIAIVAIQLSPSIVLLLPVYGAVLAFLPFDLKGQVMMGDTGSNVLGITLGMVSVWVLPISWRLVVLGCLILLHVYTEKFSLTETIKRVAFLRWIDEWGLPK